MSPTWSPLSREFFHFRRLGIPKVCFPSVSILQYSWSRAGKGWLCAFRMCTPKVSSRGDGSWCACCTLTLVSLWHTHGCPSCCSALGKKKKVFSHGQVRHSLGKLQRCNSNFLKNLPLLFFYVSCFTAQKSGELLWGVRWLALTSDQQFWKALEDFKPDFLKFFWANRTEIIENPLIRVMTPKCLVASRIVFTPCVWSLLL